MNSPTPSSANSGKSLPLVWRLLLLLTLTLGLLLPVSWVQQLIRERLDLRREAEARVAAGFGAPQQIHPPLLMIDVNITEAAGTRWVRLALLPEHLQGSVQLHTEMRHIGIYEVPVFVANVELQGKFPREELDTLLREHPEIAGVPLQLRLGLSDPRGLREFGRFSLGGQALEVGPLPMAEQAQTGLHWLGAELPLDGLRSMEFELAFSVSGTGSLAVLPRAQTIDLAYRGDWADPSFVGGLSPLEYQNDAAGFSARFVSNAFQLAQPLAFNPAQWPAFDDGSRLLQVGLFEAASTYQRNERCGKYALLFIGLTVFGFFLAELLLGLRIHPLHYLQIGAALTMFYLLLLALSEQLAFGLSYLLAATTVCLLLGGYCAAVLGARRRGVVVASVIGLIYGFLFVLVTSAELSLLLGALGLTLLLGLTMYCTRRIDWYALDLLPATTARTTGWSATE